MKILPIIMVVAIFAGKSNSSIAQGQEAQLLLLNVEKLAQLKAILKNMYDGYRVVIKGYQTIKDISHGNYNLHKGFFDALLQVSPAVRKYKKIADIISYQKGIMQDHKRAFEYFKGTGSFTSGELKYLRNVYNNIFLQSLKDIEELLLVITANRLRMSDNERLEAIDRIFEDMQDKFTFLQSFNNSTQVLAVQRLREQAEVEISRKLSDIK